MSKYSECIRDFGFVTFFGVVYALTDEVEHGDDDEVVNLGYSPDDELVEIYIKDDEVQRVRMYNR